jgi:transcriptional regulator with XRE-family HTH domain
MPRWTDENRTPLAKIRAKAGFSRNQASVKLDVGFNTLGRYEIGTNDVPMGVAEAMAALYSVPFDEIRAAVAQTKKQP